MKIQNMKIYFMPGKTKKGKQTSNVSKLQRGNTQPLSACSAQDEIQKGTDMGKSDGNGQLYTEVRVCEDSMSTRRGFRC